MSKKINTNKTCKQAVTFAKETYVSQARGNSINMQNDELNEYCIRNNLSVIKNYNIVVESTKYARKHIYEMLDFVKKQKHKTAIIVYSVDKLQRNFEASEELSKLVKADKIEIHFLREGLVIHKDSLSEDIMRWDMYVCSAQMTADIMKTKVMQAQLYNLAKGKWQSFAPIGYINVRDKYNRANIEVDPECAPLVKKLFEEYATGKHSIKSLTEFAKELNLCSKRGRQSKPISQTCVNNLLNNQFYIGKMLVKGQLIPHIYPSIIDKALFDKVQEVLSQKRR